MKKVKMSSYGDIATKVKNALFVLMLFFAFAVSVQEAGAQVVQGPPPNWMAPAEANAIIVQEMEQLQIDLNALPPGPAFNALSEVMELYDLIQAYIVQLNKVDEAVYTAFEIQMGQMPIVYASGSAPANIDAYAGSVTYTPQFAPDDAQAPNINAPNYNDILSLYEEISGRLSY